MTKLIKTYFPVLTLSTMLCLCTISLAQDTTYVDAIDLIEARYVTWIDQIPSEEISKKNSKKGWLKRLILGESNEKQLQKPVCILTNNVKDFIILDQGNGTIFIANDKTIEIPKLLRKQESYFPSLVDACILPDNSILFTDSKLNKIFKLSKDYKQLHELNKVLVVTQPTGIAFSEKEKQIWVVETAAHRISILDITGKRIKSFGERGNNEGEFNYPTSICFGPNGNAYIVDALNYRIQIFDSQGNFVSMFGENGNGTGYFASPKGIATDSFGNIYVVDALFHTIQIFDKNGNYLYHFGNQGREKEEFWMPSGIYIDKNNQILIADSYNTRVQIFNLNAIE